MKSRERLAPFCGERIFVPTSRGSVTEVIGSVLTSAVNSPSTGESSPEVYDKSEPVAPNCNMSKSVLPADGKIPVKT